MEKMKRPQKETNEEVPEHIGENKTLLNNIQFRKAKCILHIVRRIYCLREVTEGQITEVKEAKSS